MLWVWASVVDAKHPVFTTGLCLLTMDAHMDKWYKYVGLSLSLCVRPTGQARLNKQLCLWTRKEPQEGCSVVHFSPYTLSLTTQTHTLLYTSSFTCPVWHLCLPVLLPLHLPHCSLPTHCSPLSDREECYSMWPLTHSKEGCWFRKREQGAAAVMSPSMQGNTQMYTGAQTSKCSIVSQALEQFWL